MCEEVKALEAVCAVLERYAGEDDQLTGFMQWKDSQ